MMESARYTIKKHCKNLILKRTLAALTVTLEKECKTMTSQKTPGKTRHFIGCLQFTGGCIRRSTVFRLLAAASAVQFSVQQKLIAKNRKFKVENYIFLHLAIVEKAACIRCSYCKSVDLRALATT